MRVRLGLIGAGRIGRAHLEAALRAPEVEVVGVADLRGDVRAEVQRRGVKAYRSVRQMLREADLEAVIVATPPTSHLPISMRCLEGGAHVLCEKPLALGVAEVEAVAEAAEKRGLLLMMSSKFRFVPTVRHGREILLGGGLGEIVSFHIAFCARVDMSGRWNLEPASGGGVVADNLPHAADIVGYLLGPITHVFAAPGRTSPGIEVEDSASLLMRVDSNLLGVVELSWTHDRPDADFFSVHGTSGCLHIGWQGLRHRTTSRGDWVRLEQSYDKDAALRAQIANFARALRGVGSPAITVGEALAGTRVLVAARRSLVSDRWERV
jgi:predicted dehydrogenase